jgi:hypothetical protein
MGCTHRFPWCRRLSLTSTFSFFLRTASLVACHSRSFSDAWRGRSKNALESSLSCPLVAGYQPQVCICAKAWLCLPAAADNLNETSISFAAAYSLSRQSYEHQPQVCIGAKVWLCLPAAADNLTETSVSFASLAAMDIELRTTIPLAVSSNTPFAVSAILSVKATGPSTTFLVGSAWTPETIGSAWTPEKSRKS